MGVRIRNAFIPVLRVICAIAVLLYGFFAPLGVNAATGINQVINFQGKVTNTDGTNVTDGTYDFVFKLYDGAGSGASTLFTESWTAAALWSSTMSSAPSSGGESLTYSSNTNESTIKAGQILWNTTKGESVVVVAVNTGTNVITISPTAQAWANGDTVTNKVYVKDGIFRVAVNGLNQDLSGVNFNSDTIFMGVNFNADGEMKPRIQYTAVPYAFNAQKVNGLTVTATTGTLTIPNSKTIQFADAFTTSGANPLTLTTTSSTNVTLPTTGTLSTLAGSETLTNKIIGSTGLTFSGADTDITTGTDEHFSIIPNGAGNVGIGMTNPAAKLDIKSGGTNTDVLKLIASDGSRLGRFTETSGGSGWFEVDDSSGTAVALFRGDGGASYISTGTVGIGTTSPTSKLHVSGKVTGKALAIFDETGDQALLTASASGVTKFIVDHNGNVGIGTTAPIALLDVRGKIYMNDGGSAGAPTLAFYNDDNTGLYRAGGDILSFVANGQPGLTLDGTSGVGRFVIGPRNSQPVSRLQIVDDNNNSASGITFGESSSTYIQMYKSGSNKLAIAGGSVGIGTTAPIGKLHVANLVTGKALAIFDEEGDQDILTASASGTTKVTINRTGNLTFNQASTLGTSTGALTLQAAGTGTISTVQVGAGGAGSTTPDYFALDVKSDTGDPAGGFEGAMYYNTADNKFRCYQGSAWADCIGSGGSGPWTDGTGITYLTDTAEDFTVGASTLTAALSVDVSENTVRIGTGSTANGALAMYGSDGDTGSVTYTTNDGWAFEGGNVGIGTTNAHNSLEVQSTTSPQVRFAYDTSNYVTVAVASNGSVTFDATGAGAGLTFSDAITASSTLASTGTVTIGSAGNTFTFDPSSGPLYAGTARPAKTMKITPEFLGSTLTASGSATTNGTMTSDTVRDTTAGWENYYEWSSTQASFQDYTIAVKVTLPADFGAWATSNALQINYVTENTSNVKNKLDISIYNMTTNPDKIVYQSLSNVSGTNGVWTTATVDKTQLSDSTSPDWDTAGQTALIFLKPYSLVDGANCTTGVDNGCYVRIGDITLNYLGKF